LDTLLREMAMKASLVKGSREIAQLHLGGGTPTFLNDAQMTRLIEGLRTHFRVSDSAQCSIELDPRGVTAARIAHLGSLGFNRISVGVQDFDPVVQRAVNRIQSVEETEIVLNAARENGFVSTGVDLIYGLPGQTLDSFDATLATLIRLAPDRVAIYHYAHLPKQFMPQRRIDEAMLPGPEVRPQLLRLAIDRLHEAGYVHVGMDHFARPDDELAQAQRHGRLQRNFQGYSTHAGCDLLGLGVSAISRVGASFAQNHRTIESWTQAIDDGELPVMRGLNMTADDSVRSAVIGALMCHFELSIEAIESAYAIDFKKYFSAELDELAELEAAGLLTIEPDWIAITPRGRLLVRAVCMVFDRYLRLDSETVRYSKVV
ncbi:MAG: oxygen-independent coproporphyrinogen III oxidase, partial [Methyloversatilis sp.]|nr:oxygen-independent coproporphyrinogen III oxidase [Methyloversatilis sp.]